MKCLGHIFCSLSLGKWVKLYLGRCLHRRSKLAGYAFLVSVGQYQYQWNLCFNDVAYELCFL